MIGPGAEQYDPDRQTRNAPSRDWRLVQTSNSRPDRQADIHGFSGGQRSGYDPTPRAVEKANEYCASHGLVATVTELHHTEFPRIATQAQFACTDADIRSLSVLRSDQ